MRVQVDCRTRKGREIEPRSFVLGRRRLWVAEVLERYESAEVRRFRLRTVDGREFLLIQDSATGDWRLGGVAPAAAR